jgi:hypothetical protein
LLKLAPACSSLLKSKLHFALRSALRSAIPCSVHD